MADVQDVTFPPNLIPGNVFPFSREDIVISKTYDDYKTRKNKSENYLSNGTSSVVIEKKRNHNKKRAEHRSDEVEKRKKN